MNSSDRMMIKNKTKLSSAVVATVSGVVFAREAGLPFRPDLSSADPFAEWLSLMEVVQILCPTWPVREKSMLGKAWKL
jgi:hypothetical protein